MFPSDLAALLRTMTPTDLAARLRAAAAATVNPLAPVAELGTDLPPYAPGQRLVARILAPLPDGSFRASVDGRTIRVHLDQPAQAGDQLELEVTGHQDKSVLARQVAVPTRHPTQPATTTAPPNAALSAETAVASRNAAAFTTLSAAGQRIADALASDTAATPTVAATRAALPAHEVEPAKIAAAISRALTRSGLFYESHQARWVEGRMPLAELVQEPQARLMAAQPQPAAPVQPPTPATANPGTALPAPPSPQSNTPGPDDAAPPTVVAGAPHRHDAPDAARPPSTAMAQPFAEDDHAPSPERSTAQRNSVGELAAELRPLVHQQLNALSQQQVSLQLPLWPGIDLQMEIVEPGRDDETVSREGMREDADAPPWRSRLRLELPHLGEITAVLELRASRLALTLHASHDTAAQLAANGADLRGALEHAGLRVDGMQVGERE